MGTNNRGGHRRNFICLSRNYRRLYSVSTRDHDLYQHNGIEIFHNRLSRRFSASAFKSLGLLAIFGGARRGKKENNRRRRSERDDLNLLGAPRPGLDESERFQSVELENGMKGLREKPRFPLGLENRAWSPEFRLSSDLISARPSCLGPTARRPRPPTRGLCRFMGSRPLFQGRGVFFLGLFPVGRALSTSLGRGEESAWRYGPFLAQSLPSNRHSFERLLLPNPAYLPQRFMTFTSTYSTPERHLF